MKALLKNIISATNIIYYFLLYQLRFKGNCLLFKVNLKGIKNSHLNFNDCKVENTVLNISGLDNRINLNHASVLHSNIYISGNNNLLEMGKGTVLNIWHDSYPRK